MKHKLQLTLILLFVTTFTFAQVTIGSAKKPVEGAILELNDGTDTDLQTAQKGLGLPRVNLINKIPDTPELLAKSIGSTGEWNLEEHTGLVVYNVSPKNECEPEEKQIDQGLYVWNGREWISMNEKTVERTTDHYAETFDETTSIGTVTDYEGNVYPTKRWTSSDGTKVSGIWMTKNLQSIRKADGTFIDCPNALLINPGYAGFDQQAVEGVVIAVRASIPEGIIEDYTFNGEVISGQSNADFVNTFGLLYSHD